jgi:DNA primase
MTNIDKIRESYPIAPFVARYTGGLQSSGNGFLVGFCPFHQSTGHPRKTFWVSPKLGLCNCFVPRCRAEKPMDIVNFYARIMGIDNQRAVSELSKGDKKCFKN